MTKLSLAEQGLQLPVYLFKNYKALRFLNNKKNQNIKTCLKPEARCKPPLKDHPRENGVKWLPPFPNYEHHADPLLLREPTIYHTIYHIPSMYISEYKIVVTKSSSSRGSH